MGAAIDQQLEGQDGDPGVRMHASIVEGAGVTRLFVYSETRLLLVTVTVINSTCILLVNPVP
jgi:uncharacterized protein with von Willebrand factor type A (vWA) domain